MAKTKNSQPLCTLIAVVLFLSACAPDSSIVDDEQKTSTPVLPTATIAPSATVTPLPTSTLVAIPSPTNTLTAIPTLSVEQARVRLLELLANNSGCHLPCFWGITPGKSTYQEVRTILMPVSSIAYATYLGSSTSGNVDLHYVEDGLKHYWNVGFTSPESGIVNHISVLAKASKEFPDGNMDNFDSATFGKRAAYYSLTNVLSEQGMPASVVMQTLGNQITGKDVESFHILLIYPDRGLFVHYSTYSQVVGAKLRGCPANAHIELELYLAGDADGFSKALSQTDWAFAWPKFVSNLYWKSIEEATSMTLEQFYKTFREPTNKCIETPAKMWPMPESGGG